MVDTEYRSEDALRELQDRLLRRHIRYVADNSAFYARMLDRLHIDPDAIGAAEDLARLPFTTKGDIENFHGDLLCVGEEQIVDLCLTSGTTGKPVAMLQTSEDLDRLGYNEEVSFRAAGIGREDRVLVAASIDRCFMAGMAYFLGLRRIGAMVIRGGSSSPAILAELVRSTRPTVLVGVPTLILSTAEKISADGGEPSRLGVGKIICIGEPVRQKDLGLSPLGRRLRERWNAEVLSTYASTEMATAFCDCDRGAGGHLHPDLIVLEIVDEEGRVLPPGSEGEIVATPLQVTGMPLVRFRTGDVAAMHREACRCGRNSPRLGPITGRKSQMLKFRGTTLYPQSLFSVLQQIEGIRGYYVEVRDEFELSDQIRVVAGVEGSNMKASQVAAEIAAHTRVKPEVVFVEPERILAKTVQENKRKPQTFFDYRGKKSERT